MNKHFILFLLVTCSIALISCDKDDDQNTNNTEYELVINNIASDVILETYKVLFSKTDDLHLACEKLKDQPTEENLAKAREAWRLARIPWEQSEGFLFGPVDQQGIDPSIDSWPVNQPDLDAVLNSSNVLTKDYIDGLDGTLKGFHTIEYLLFGIDNKRVEDFTLRQYEYLSACSASLNGATMQLYEAWHPTYKNFIAKLLTAGSNGNTTYLTQKSVLEEISNGMVTIADEVANGKINDPYSQQNINLEESRFSANSKADFADNIRSIQNAYLGQYGGNTNAYGITSIIIAKDTNLDQKIKSQIVEAINAIESIPGTFTTAIFNQKAAVENAQTKVRNLQLTLESGLLPIISNL